MSQEIIWLSTQETITQQLVGGKGFGLMQLSRLGLPVPPGFILTTAFFTTNKTHLHKKQYILDAYRQLGDLLNVTNPAVAVRSSATNEDGQLHSFAGAYDTFLWVQGAEHLLEKINLCQDSLFSERAAIYHQDMEKQTTAVPQMAIIVQAMIPAKAAGVLMTLNPVNGDRSKIAIESTWGVSQLLVDGTINPDRFLVDKITDEIIDQSIARKTKMLQENEMAYSGTSVINVPESLQDSASLSPDEIKNLCNYGRILEIHFSLPQDIEFATFQDQLYILQTRPETVWTRKKPKFFGLNQHPIDQIVTTLTNFGKKHP